LGFIGRAQQAAGGLGAQGVDLGSRQQATFGQVFDLGQLAPEAAPAMIAAAAAADSRAATIQNTIMEAGLADKRGASEAS
jgi:hypothetical protein